jgi:PAS domain S-box-containing protein
MVFDLAVSSALAHGTWGLGLNQILASTMFIPHGHCYLWKPGLVWLHLVSDALTALAYYSIPITLVYFVRKRQDLPFDWVFLLFGAFIVACGTTHILDVWTLWHPTYWLSGSVKAVTATVSLFTAAMIVPLVPKALALPSPALLAATNRELELEIAERRKSEARYRAIVEDQTELIVRFQPDGTLNYVNEAYCRYFGLNQHEIIGKTYQPVVFEADRERVAQLVQSITVNNPVVTIENRVIAKGVVRWTQWTNRALLDEGDRFVEFQAVGRDITEQKQVELALEESKRFIQKITDTAPVLLYVYDFLAGRNIYVNREVLDVLGYSSADIQKMNIDSLRPLLHPDDWAIMLERQQRWSSVSENDILQTEYRLKHANGEWRYFQCQETLFATASDGTPQQILGAAVDITDRKQTQQLQASLKEKDVLLKEIHHRVKNNLQIVYSMLRLQLRQIQESPVAEVLLESQNRVRSIALVHEKLYRSDDLASVDFSQYIYSLVAHLFSSYNIHSNAVMLETDIDSISLDIDQAVPCGLIINELVSNALKYAFPNRMGGIIRIDLHLDEQSQVILTVSDNGIGIPEFLKLDQLTSLGLQLVQDFVEQLEGTLHIDRHSGTTFRITFPGSIP